MDSNTKILPMFGYEMKDVQEYWIRRGLKTVLQYMSVSKIANAINLKSIWTDREINFYREKFDIN